MLLLLLFIYSVMSDSFFVPMEYSWPVSSVYDIFQARILEQVTILFCKASSWPKLIFPELQVDCLLLNHQDFPILIILYLKKKILKYVSDQIRSDQSFSRVRLFATPWIAARQASLSITNSWSSLKFMSIKSVMPSSHLILCRPLLLLPPIPPSIRVFSN